MRGADKTYAERVKSNIGEELFESYCAIKGYKAIRIGFDEQNGFVDNYFNLSTLLRNLPDYVVNTPTETFVVCVKGTANFKKKEYDMLPLMMEWFSSKKAPLVYSFCFEGKEPKLVYPEKIINLYQQAQDRQWNDGVVYRNLALD